MFTLFYAPMFGKCSFVARCHIFSFLLLRIEQWNLYFVSSHTHKGLYITCFEWYSSLPPKYFVFLYDILRPRKEVPWVERITARKPCPYLPVPLQPHVNQSNPLVPSQNHVTTTTNIPVNKYSRRDYWRGKCTGFQEYGGMNPWDILPRSQYYAPIVRFLFAYSDVFVHIPSR